MKKKKFVLPLVTSTAAVLMLTACGTGGNEAPTGGGAAAGAGTGAVSEPGGFGWRGAMPDFSVGDTFRATEPIELSLLFRELPELAWSDDLLVVDMLREITNVNFAGNTTAVGLEDFHTQRQLLIASGQAPEVMPVMYAQYVAQFVPGGAMLPISEFWHHMPHFQHYATTWGLWDDIEWLRQADGHIYHLPGMQEDVALRFTVAMRYDILRQLGLAVPDTWDEIRDVLRVVQANFPGVFPYIDRWTLDSTLNTSARTFGVRFGWGMGNGLILDHDTLTHAFITELDGLRQFVEYWHSLIAEGLLDPESFVEYRGREEFINGETFMTGVFWTDAPVFYVEMAELLEAGITPGVFGLEGAEIVTLPVPNGPTGRVGIARLNNGLILNNSIRYRDDFIAILQFIDWLYYSEEGREFAMWGQEGVTFERVNGQRQLLPGFTGAGWGGVDNPAYQDMFDLGFNTNPFSATHGGSQDLTISVVSENLAQLHIANSTRVPHLPNPNPPFNTLEQEQASILAGQLTSMANEQVREFIIGRRPMSEWDAFVAEVYAAGVPRLTELADTALARHLGN